MSKVLMVASEATPFSKTGGLADVVGALPFALRARGEELAVVLPLYRETAGKVIGAEPVYDSVPVKLRGEIPPVSIRRVVERDVPFFLVDCPEYFDRGGLYGENGVDFAHNHLRFGAFCHAALTVVRSLWRPDILHIHDWQACLTGPYMRVFYGGDPTFYGVRLLLTIHNLGYQGLFPPSALDDLMLPRSLNHPSLLEFYGKVSLLKAGIVFADAVTTVSPTYSEEIQTADMGAGLDGLLRERRQVLTGILNGVDYDDWSPENDALIPAPYSSEDLNGKRTNKAELLRRFDLPAEKLNVPLVGMVSRFVAQKGFDLIEQAAAEIASEDMTLVALGSGETRFEEALQKLAAENPGKISVIIGYDNELAHLIEAGSDIFLMPSLYEPCGLNQIYSLRYGTVPVVRATGGLDDTIDEETGFKFREYSGAALVGALHSALAAYKDRASWTRLMRRGMSKDFSWDISAEQYSLLYKRLSNESFLDTRTSIEGRTKWQL